MKKLILTMVCGFLLLSVHPSFGENTVIQKGSKVAFHYTLTVDGQVFDTSEGKEPLSYTHGESMIIPGLEKELEGLKESDSKKVTVAAEEAYGTRNEELKAELPITSLEGKVDPQVGMVLQMQGPQGQPMSGLISEVKDTTIMLDFNHPLAGKELTFDVSIVTISE